MNFGCNINVTIEMKKNLNNVVLVFTNNLQLKKETTF